MRGRSSHGLRFSRLGRAAFAVLVAATLGLAEPSWSAPAGRGGAETFTFAFHEADVVQVVQEVMGQVGAPYTIDPAVTGKLSFRIDQRLTREQLLAAFDAILANNGIALVRNGDQYVITPQAKAKSAASISTHIETTHASGYEVVAVPLAYAAPSEVGKALSAIASESPVVYVNDRLGLLLLGGSGGQLKTAMETVKLFDQSTFADAKIRWFELGQAQATTVAEELDRIIQGSGMVGTAVVPLKRLNGVIIFGRSSESLTELGKWVTRLDVPGKDTATSLWVYHPHASSAEALARTLSTLLGFQAPTDSGVTNRGGGPNGYGNRPFGDSSPLAAAPAPSSAPAAPISGGTAVAGEDPVRVGVDKDTNTLIISTSSARWVQIQRILAEIDRTPRQILIEASILEVTLTKGLEFGVDWTVLSKNLTVGSVSNGTGTVTPSFPGFSATYLQGDIKASVSALGSLTTVEVVSAPKIIALDNKTARLQVGDQVPVVTQSAQSQVTTGAPLVNSVDYRSTGVILNVTPRVTGEDQLILEVEQEVSNVSKTVTSGIDSPTIQQRRFESTLVMHDGALVALGGLISGSKTDGNSGVPYLKDVPVVGALFRSTSHDVSRTELIVLLTARIIRDRPAEKAVMADLLKDMQELQAHGLLPAAR
jgi:general secretion pathway protein D